MWGEIRKRRFQSIGLMIPFGIDGQKTGKIEYPVVPAPVRQLEDQMGEILELVKWCKEKREKTGQAPRDSGEETGSVSFGG
jgi:hypothetical protein